MTQAETSTEQDNY